MTQTSFISRINWRQILPHFIATCFFIYSAQMAVYLFDTHLVDIIRQSSNEDVKTNISDNGTTVSQLFYFSMRIGMAGFIGLIVAFFISLLISLRHRWFWFNSVITFALAYVCYKLNLLGTTYITAHFLNAIGFLKNTFLEFFICSFTLFLLGLLVFFSRLTRKFIENR